MAIFTTAEHAFHADPLGHDNLLGVDPLVIGMSPIANFLLKHAS